MTDYDASNPAVNYARHRDTGLYVFVHAGEVPEVEWCALPWVWFKEPSGRRECARAWLIGESSNMYCERHQHEPKVCPFCRGVPKT
ncbi:MAG TPA: hypothetical protein VGO53_16225 [Steroidobacteraceae bacterium]|jgi:hypothetical protein|nr:hypothetical protein [Steroidobacteraceae bacterium]